MKVTTSCPECGCEEFTNENLISKGYRTCTKCYQEYWTGINYPKHIKNKLMSTKLPFNYTLYQTGNYIAECRNGYRPEEVLQFKNGNLVFKNSEGAICLRSQNGLHVSEMETSIDLFLIPKEVVKYRAIYPPETGYPAFLHDTIKKLIERPSYDHIAIERITFIQGELPKVEVLPVQSEVFHKGGHVSNETLNDLKNML